MKKDQGYSLCTEVSREIGQELQGPCYTCHLRSEQEEQSEREKGEHKIVRVASSFSEGVTLGHARRPSMA